ncbi:low temperature requirement protein A [Solirubrobacter sp. CPCC 204708]|uniref:Low temperature requirement protein A n=1 Tax=Solirubrobacter deserti TaxID=2282478 RepID=A0ABT4RDJ5_9ACTN|nr:low temperature requirement protein A [Solirubrobacter deserti]MBE2314604.1 low temperature requirement protein A [Solirubrobacter deserti]MDA0136608.1 low temperature requirement protein A [Solirubrobacter deserti]
MTADGHVEGERRAPLIRPPALHTGEGRTASRLELFFDLAYVLVVAELATAFVDDLTWHGTGVFAGLFATIWFSWVGFTLYANRFDTDDVVFRVIKLVATLAIAGCAASATEATGSLGWAFAASFLVARIMLVLLYLRAWRHVQPARGTIGVYLAAATLSAALWAVSIALTGTGRYVLWGVAVLLDVAAPLLATRHANDVPLHLEHLPERFGLLVILVLGEAVGATVTGVHDAKWAGAAVGVAVLGFALTAALWWNYFDVGAASSAEDLQEREAHPSSADHEGERHDLFIYGHLPLTLGIAIAGIGLEDLVLHPDAPLPSAGGWALGAGVALFFAGAAIIVAGADHRWRTAFPWPAAAIPIVVVPALIPGLSATVAAAAVAIIALTAAVVGTRARRR